MSVEDSEWVPQPPSPERVAARALVLAAVVCRALIERDRDDPSVVALHQSLSPWLEEMGVAGEAEPDEAAWLATPLGEADEEEVKNASWRSEGMAVLAWALGCAPLPPYHEQCVPESVADSLGLLRDREDTVLHSPTLRATQEIEHCADTYLAVHWRLREYTLNPVPIDFPADAGDLPIGDLEMLDRDLSVDGTRLDQLPHRRFREVLSIVQERRQAFGWLEGFEALYSEVTTDT